MYSRNPRPRLLIQPLLLLRSRPLLLRTALLLLPTPLRENLVWIGISNRQPIRRITPRTWPRRIAPRPRPRTTPRINGRNNRPCRHSSSSIIISGRPPGEPAELVQRHFRDGADAPCGRRGCEHVDVVVVALGGGGPSVGVGWGAACGDGG